MSNFVSNFSPFAFNKIDIGSFLSVANWIWAICRSVIIEIKCGGRWSFAKQFREQEREEMNEANVFVTNIKKCSSNKTITVCDTHRVVRSSIITFLYTTYYKSMDYFVRTFKWAFDSRRKNRKHTCVRCTPLLVHKSNQRKRKTAYKHTHSCVWTRRSTVSSAIKVKTMTLTPQRVLINHFMKIVSARINGSINGTQLINRFDINNEYQTM